MGATNSTTHYELSQFIGTDKPAWLQDYNGDMAKIDTGIYNAKTAADNAQSAADGAQGDATSALSSISDINTELGSVENTLSTATGNINTINSLIGNGTPTTTDQTIIGAINELNSDKAGKSDIGYSYKTVRVDANVSTESTDTVAEAFAKIVSAINGIKNSLSSKEAFILERLRIGGLGTTFPEGVNVRLSSNSDLTNYGNYSSIVTESNDLRILTVSLDSNNPLISQVKINFSDNSVVSEKIDMTETLATLGYHDINFTYDILSKV